LFPVVFTPPSVSHQGQCLAPICHLSTLHKHHRVYIGVDVK
jgi:hypothetical protein